MGREATVYLAGFTSAGVLQLAVVPLYTRSLGPTEYGYLALTIAATTVARGIMSLGGEATLARFWADTGSEQDRKVLASTWIGFLAAWSVLVAALACTAAPWLANELEPGASIAVLLVLGFLVLVPAQASRMLAQILRNRFRPVPFAATQVTVAVLNAALGVLFGVTMGLGVQGVILGMLVGESLGCVARLPLVRTSLGPHLSQDLLRPLLRFGAPYIPISVALWVFVGADRLVIGASTSGGRQLGAYAVASSLVGPFTVVTLSLSNAWLPRVSALFVEDDYQARQTTARAIGLALAVLGLAATIVGMLAVPLVAIVGGEGFGPAASALPLLALGSAFFGTSMFTGTGLSLTKQTHVTAVVAVSAAALDLLLLVLLVPRFGLVGAAGAVAASYFVLASANLVAANRKFPLPVSVRGLTLLSVGLAGQSALATLRPGSATVITTGAALCAVLGVVIARQTWPSRAGGASSSTH